MTDTIEKNEVNTAQDSKNKKVAEQIQAVLETNGMALQPFVIYAESGVHPSVRLVEVTPENNDGQANNTGEDAVAEVADESTGTTQS